MNSELENLIKQGVKYVDIGFENCECMIVPIEDIIEFTSLNNEINCVMKLSDKASYGGFGYNSLTPLQRIAQYDDITSFELRDKDMNLIQKIDFPWYDPEPDNPYATLVQNNEYQKSNLIGWNKLSLSIKESNKRFSLKEILGFNKEMTIEDEKGNTYKVKRNKQITYINTIITEEILNAKFLIQK